MSYEVEDLGYNDGNRAFLQAFMARSTLTFEEAKPVLAAIFSAHGSFILYYFNRLLCSADGPSTTPNLC